MLCNQAERAMYMYMHNDYFTTEEIKTRKMGAIKVRKLSYKKETKFKVV